MGLEIRIIYSRFLADDPTPGCAAGQVVASSRVVARLRSTRVFLCACVIVISPAYRFFLRNFLSPVEESVKKDTLASVSFFFFSFSVIAFRERSVGRHPQSEVGKV